MIMFTKNYLQGLVLALTVLLAACTTNQPKKTVEVEPPPPPAPTVAITPQVAPPPDPAIVVPNPSIVTFEKMSITLDEKAKVTISQLASRAKISSKISITGYCDKNQIRNAPDSAMARAVAVRDVLLSYGIEPANISMTLVTNTPKLKKHAAEIKFD